MPRRPGAEGMIAAIVRSSIVMPAKAGIHNHRPVVMGPGFRRDDTENEMAQSILNELLAA